MKAQITIPYVWHNNAYDYLELLHEYISFTYNIHDNLFDIIIIKLEKVCR